jgi:hypothetical protein
MDWLTAVLLLVAGGVIGVALSPSEDWLKEWILGLGGELSGKWREELAPAYHKNYKRVDDLVVRHRRRSGRLIVRVTRIEPTSEAGRRWRMSGFVRGDEAFLVFWPIGKRYDGSSYGVIMLHRDAASAGAKWVGAYVRPGTDIGRLPGASNMERIEMSWTRR